MILYPIIKEIIKLKKPDNQIKLATLQFFIFIYKFHAW